jgi:two-component system, chemotaxis family, sensor kinase CheA
VKEHLRQRLLQIFCTEHADHLSVIRQFLEHAAQADFTPEQLNEAFRRAHSLKGAARAVDLAVIEQGFHQVEGLFAKVQTREIALQPLINVLHQWLDLSEDWLAAQIQQLPPPDPAPSLAALKAVFSQEPMPVPEPECVPAPSTPAAAPEPTPVSEAASLATEATVRSASAIEPLFDAEFLRISAQRLDTLLDSADRLSAESQHQKQIGYSLRQFQLKIAEMESYWQLCQAELSASPQRESLTYALRELAQWTQESRLEQEQSAWKFSQEVLYLQNNMREIRMQPARSLFQTFPKMLRRLAQEQGKEIQCHFTGLEIEADRAVLQSLKDPVMHILRNALAHGIEKPEERRQKGKNPVGQISCQLEVRRHQLVIRIADDGQGLHQERIHKTLAVRDPELIENGDWQNAIFQAGFSTSQGVDELSGRGMGLSVVAESIARLQGQYRMLEQPVGVCFELEVPLQIVTYRLLLFSCQAQAFALPAAAVHKLLRFQMADLRTLDGQSTLIWQEQPIPFFNLSQFLFQAQDAIAADSFFSVVIVESGQNLIALQVDTLLSEQESLLRPLTGPASQLPLYLGAVLSSQGQPVPVLNPHFLGQISQNQSAFAQTVWHQAAVKEKARILVVDDSITTRTLEKTILESQGYRVAVAVDGREALKKLREAPFDLVISDVQMPEMDGLELLATLKQDPHLADLPVIMLTSLNAYEDQKKGLELGAAAYLVKQKFEQQELLEVIEQLL